MLLADYRAIALEVEAPAGDEAQSCQQADSHIQASLASGHKARGLVPWRIGLEVLERNVVADSTALRPIAVQYGQRACPWVHWQYSMMACSRSSGFGPLGLIVDSS